MWRAGHGFQLGLLDELYRQPCGVVNRYDLVVLAVDEQRGHVEALEILGQVGFGERFDTKVRGGETSHAALVEEGFANALGRARARPVVTVKRQAQILP